MRLIDADRFLEQIGPDVSDEVMETIMDKINDIPTVYPILSNRTVGKTIANEYFAMCNTLEDYGISTTNPLENLNYVLSQYQTIICELTGSMLSKLTYNAKDVLAYINDEQDKIIKEEAKELCDIMMSDQKED